MNTPGATCLTAVDSGAGSYVVTARSSTALTVPTTFSATVTDGSGTTTLPDTASVTFDSTPAPASNLRTEQLGDGSANCLEKAMGLARPGDSIVLIRDASDGVGHALVRRPDGSVVDPNHPTVRYETLGQWQATHPRYSQPVPVPAGKMQQVLSTPPGPQREALIQKLGLSGVADRQVADGERWVLPNGNMNIRSGPGVTFDDIGDLTAGDKLKVIGQNEDASWLNVELENGTQAWVKASLVKEEVVPPPPYESPFPQWMADGTRPPDIEMHVWNALPKESRAEIIQTAREKVVAENWPMPEFDVNGPPPPSFSSMAWSHLPSESKQAIFQQEWQAAVSEQTQKLFSGVQSGGEVPEHSFLGTASTLGRGKAGEWREFAVHPHSAAQYLNLNSMWGGDWRTVHKNLCGPLAVGASMGVLPQEALTRFAASNGDISEGLLNTGYTTGKDDLIPMYTAEKWTTDYSSGDALPPEDFARFLADGKSLVALVNINPDGADGMLRAGGTAHFVNVRAVEENGNGDWMVRVYNPYQNREEVYSWKDFKASWTQTEGNNAYGLLIATPPPPDAAPTP
ncbi:MULTISPECIES: SH3 domain-containing protein [Corallococcus]|uniref:SH3 domain-containing protein n=1 Tax=Corallococcus TaxID=83461 RepID=UPI0011C39404|nr:SH3 domain-containing protein [Corallococcus sp. CA041A]NRD55445.1 SH3 domain-containing protein [Corallococcus exiguus]